ncbi:hypothetical protein TNCV_657261 [Trichonephila clavipes]|nr:hypothetical protein TNCV_657261 [Trichonephila clavipes]
MTELKKELLQTHNTSPGQDGITYTMLRQLNPKTLTYILFYSTKFGRSIACPPAGGEAIVIQSLSRARTSPVTSLYVVCHEPPLELRRRQLSAKYFIRVMAVPSHPLKTFSLVIGLTRLYEAHSFNIKPFRNEKGCSK